MTKNLSSYNRVLHYIPPAIRFADLPHEFVEPSPSDAFIHWLYRYRCADCKKPGTEVNEIIPRSRSKNAVMDWTNRILLCSECHRRYHHNGVTDAKINEMRQIRRSYLEAIGRGEYVNGKAG